MRPHGAATTETAPRSTVRLGILNRTVGGVWSGRAAVNELGHLPRPQGSEGRLSAECGCLELLDGSAVIGQ